MAYNRENLLLKIIDIQNIVNEYREYDTPQIKIWEKYIEPVYHISYSCFNDYMAINAKAELKKLRAKKERQKEIDAKQMKLF